MADEQGANPEGMKAWAGGDSAPADWDRHGRNIRRNGAEALGLDWRHHHPDHHQYPYDIIAYTPIALSEERHWAREEASMSKTIAAEEDMRALAIELIANYEDRAGGYDKTLKILRYVAATPAADRLTDTGEGATDGGEVDEADVSELDAFLAAYADEPDGDLVNRVENDDLLTWGILRRCLASLRPIPEDPEEKDIATIAYMMGAKDERDRAALATHKTADAGAMRESDLNWRAVGKLAGEHGVRFRTNRALIQFLNAIRNQPDAGEPL